MTVSTVTTAAAPAAIASAVPSASRILYVGTEGVGATSRARQIRIASGHDFFKDVADLRLYGADAEPATVCAVAARVVAEQVVAPSLVVVEHAAFTSLAAVDLASLFPGANALRISG